ncbi:MAG: hypothetical protein AB8B69_25090 [Chitinophagales bacterium]
MSDSKNNQEKPIIVIIKLLIGSISISGLSKEQMWFVLVYGSLVTSALLVITYLF